MEPDCWHSVVNITQVPNMNGKDENEVSWLCDPLGGDKEEENVVYCTKFTLDKGYFSWKFYLNYNLSQPVHIVFHVYQNQLVLPGLFWVIPRQPTCP